MEALRIMLVEDDIDDIYIFAHTLKEVRPNMGFQLAQSVPEATELLFEERLPHLILLDLKMNQSNGKTLLSKISSTARLQHIPVIMLTSSESEKDIAETLALGAACYLVKPTSIGPLRNFIEIILDHLPQDLNKALGLISCRGSYVNC